MHDELGDRIKGQYEDRTRILLPRRTYTIIRVDGKAFHTFTKNCEKPFDRYLMKVMDRTAIAMCEAIQGACFAFTQSDEISLLLTDFAKPGTNAWFDGNLQKMASVAAAIATANFNKEYYESTTGCKDMDVLALFDARVFTIPDPIEVENYFIWRQNDASRNSVQMAARAVYSHKALEGKSIPQLHDLLHAKGINWNNYTTGEKRGRVIKKQSYEVKVGDLEATHNEGRNVVTRSRWVSYDGEGCSERYDIPIFTQNRIFLRDLIPEMERFAPPNIPSGGSIYDCG